MAMIALVQRTALEHAVFGMAALGTHKTRRPAPPKQCLLTLALGSVLLKKIRQTQPLLHLDSVLFHGVTPWLSAQFQYAEPRGSKAEPH